MDLLYVETMLLNSLRADVATAETEYNLALANSLTTEVAYARGFQAAGPALAYVTRPATIGGTGLALGDRP